MGNWTALDALLKPTNSTSNLISFISFHVGEYTRTIFDFPNIGRLLISSDCSVDGFQVVIELLLFFLGHIFLWF